MTVLSREDQRVLLELFVTSVGDIVESLEENLVALEESPDDAEVLAEILRHAHTLKGDSASVGLERTSHVLHSFETLLQAVRDGSVPLSGAVNSLLLATLDVIRKLAADALDGVEEPEALTSDIAARLELAAGGRLDEAVVGFPGAQSEDGDDESGPIRARGAGEGKAWREGAGSLRVSTDKLNRILDYTGEVAVAWGRVRELIGELNLRANHELASARDELQRLQLILQEEVMTVRMVPVGPTLRRQIRPCRDLATRMGKQVSVLIEGESAEIDSTVVAHLGTPLTHLVRNAIDHGIEMPEQREAAGKDPCATLTLRARHDTGCIVIEVEDDGRGLDGDRILARAREVGDDPQWTPRSPEDLWACIFEPGFSTAETVSDVSGRGVGMDAVKREVERLGGQIGVDNRPGRGLTVSLRLPLTLAVITGLEVAVGPERYLVPLSHVTECLDLSVPPEERGRAHGVLSLRSGPLPYVRLRHCVASEGVQPPRENVVVVEHSGRGFGIAVDRVIGERPTVIKPLSGVLQGAMSFAGSTILSSGDVALILDVPALLDVALRGRRAAGSSIPGTKAATPAKTEAPPPTA